MATDFDPNLTEEQILYGEREEEITLLCEKKYFPERIKRLDFFANNFPNGNYFGPGWTNGFLSEKERIPLYLKTKIKVLPPQLLPRLIPHLIFSYFLSIHYLKIISMDTHNKI